MLSTTSMGRTHVGQVRSRNEDHYFSDDGLGLFVVADGVGGEARGDVASSLAVGAIVLTIRRCRLTVDAVREGRANVSELIELVETAMERANRGVLQAGYRIAEYHGMATTLTVLVVAGRHAVMGHVGDSRLYRQRQGQLEQLSRDHTLAQQLMAAGVLTPDNPAFRDYSRRLLRVLGRPGVSADVQAVQVQPGDRFLICSDGLSDYADSAEDLDDGLRRASPGEAAEELVEFANACGGRDNITAIVVDIDEAYEELNELSGAVPTGQSEQTRGGRAGTGGGGWRCEVDRGLEAILPAARQAASG